MQGGTHKLGGAVAMLGMFEYLRLSGQTLEGVNPLVQLAIMYPASTFGALFPDIDHHEGANPVNTPAGEFFHKMIHLPDKIARKTNRNSKGKPRSKWVEKLFVIKHRAWQTHSILFTGGITFTLWSMFSNLQQHNPDFNVTVLFLMISGFAIGLLSHIILDMLTPSGVYLFMFKKIKLVPSNSFFSTGNAWETKWVTSILSLTFTFLAVSIMFSIVGIEIIPTTFEVANELVDTVTDLQ